MSTREKLYIEVLTECGYERVGEAFIDLNAAFRDVVGACQEGVRNIRLTDERGRVRVCTDENGAYLVDPVPGEQVVGF